MGFLFDVLKNLFSKKQEQIPVPTPIIEKEQPVQDFPIQINTSNSKQWKYIIIHHSETTSGEVKTWEAIKKYHMSWRYNDETVSEEQAKTLISEGKKVVKPDLDIGYHFGIASNKSINSFEYIVGRSLSMDGAHAIGFNTNSIGICCMGSFNKTMPTIELYTATKILVQKLQQIYNIPNENVIGHRETYALLNVPKAKTCPGDMWDLMYFRKLLKGQI